MSSEKDKFTSRWSKRKVAARRSEDDEVADDDAGVSELAKLQGTDQDANKVEVSPDDRLLVEEDFADVDFEALDKSSDYTRFLKANVPAAIQKRALRKLWASDSVFEVLDGMNDYDEDFTIDGLAGKAFKSAYKIGQGYLSDEEVKARDLAEAKRKGEETLSADLAEVPEEVPEEAPEETDGAQDDNLADSAQDDEPAQSEEPEDEVV